MAENVCGANKLQKASLEHGNTKKAILNDSYLLQMQIIKGGVGQGKGERQGLMLGIGNVLNIKRIGSANFADANLAQKLRDKYSINNMTLFPATATSQRTTTSPPYRPPRSHSSNHNPNLKLPQSRHQQKKHSRGTSMQPQEIFLTQGSIGTHSAPQGHPVLRGSTLMCIPLYIQCRK